MTNEFRHLNEFPIDGYFSDESRQQRANEHRMQMMRENSKKPVHITSSGRIFIGEDEFLYPVSDNSIHFKRLSKGRHELTLTLIVGDVLSERRH